jgi:hypothetical protein
MKNTIKQAKHMNDAILGKNGVFRVWRSGADADGVYTWDATLSVGGKTYTGRATTEEDARTEAAQNYKEGKYEYDNTFDVPVRYDKSNLVSSILIGNNNWWKVVQKSMVPGKFVERDDKKKQILINIELSEPDKNIFLMMEIFKFANEKIEDSKIKLSDEQITEYVQRLYPILTYSGLWNDGIPVEELDEFYEVSKEEN